MSIILIRPRVILPHVGKIKHLILLLLLLLLLLQSMKQMKSEVEISAFYFLADHKFFK